MRWNEIKKSYLGPLDQIKEMEPHDLLEVERGASRKEVETAYRRKVRTYHPDVSDEFFKPYNNEVVKYLNAAYRKMLQEIPDK